MLSISRLPWSFKSLKSRRLIAVAEPRHMIVDDVGEGGDAVGLGVEGGRREGRIDSAESWILSAPAPALSFSVS
jgi:hypothetical protein